jgi:hypothetical protein
MVMMMMDSVRQDGEDGHHVANYCALGVSSGRGANAGITYHSISVPAHVPIIRRENCFRFTSAPKLLVSAMAHGAV